MDEGFASLKKLLTKSLYKQLFDILNYSIISSYETVFLEIIQGKTDWEYINKYDNIFDAHQLIHKFRNYIDWEYISICHKLPIEFIREFREGVYWHLICEYQTLSEENIEEFKDKIDWYLICKCQTLSESFIEKFAGLIYWKVVKDYQFLTTKFKIKHEDKF